MPTNKINYKLQNFNFWKIFPVIIFMFNLLKKSNHLDANIIQLREFG